MVFCSVLPLRIFVLALVATVMASGLPARADTQLAPRAGHLIIIGGGLQSDHPEDPVFKRIGERAGATGGLGVLTTATAFAQESGPELVKEFTALVGPGRVSWLDPETQTGVPPLPGPDDATLEGRLRQVQTIYFTGGDQARITGYFRPNGVDTKSYAALKAILAAGGTIAGSSAGAAMMSDPMIKWGDSAGALVDGVSTEEDHGVGIGQGMGFFPYGQVDQHFLQRGRLGRLVVALTHQHQRFGFGVEETRGMDVDLATGRIEALGTRAILMVDTSELAPICGAYRGLVGALLATGDTVDATTGAVTPAPNTVAPAQDPNVAEPILDPWAPQTVSHLIHYLAVSGRTFASAHDDTFTVTVRRDERTRFWCPAGNADRDAISASNVKIDVVRHLKATFGIAAPSEVLGPDGAR